MSSYKVQVEVLGTNQTSLFLPNATVFLSYETPVAVYDRNQHAYFRTDQFWSNTTSKHINRWLGGREAQKVSQDVIDSYLVIGE
jgi:hypothetical protein